MYAIILYLSTATKHVEFRVGIKLVKLDSIEENHFLHNRIWNIPRYFELLSALSIDKCLSLSGSIIKSEDNDSSFFI